jgi:ATP-dependent DNA ligase
MRQQHSFDVVFCAFDLVELDGKEFYGARRSKTRKSTLKSLLRGKHAGILFNAHFTRPPSRYVNNFRDRLLVC